MLSDAELVVRGDRMALPPTGRKGGDPGGRGYWRSHHPDGTVDEFAHRQSHIRLATGRRLHDRHRRAEVASGHPLDREPASVARDVVEGPCVGRGLRAIRTASSSTARGRSTTRLRRSCASR
jgi:N-methylhydantoinase B/oxoprolinase/acetone carboxylase alpha subunit